MDLINKQFKTNDNNMINYYETNNNNKPILLIIHAQGTNALSYLKVIKDLSKNFHLFLARISDLTPENLGKYLKNKIMSIL